MKDWTQELIAEMQEAGIVADQATTAFVECYKDGDSVEAWSKFEGMAEQSEQFDPNCYMLLIFSDGSCYADWNQGIDRFFPDVADLRAEDQDVEDRLAEKEESEA